MWAGCISCLAIIVLIVPMVSAQSSQTVTIGVGDTVLVVSGSTSPAAFVTIQDNASVIGTTLADSAGRFSQTYTAQTPGIHTISVFSRDRQSRLTGTVTNTISIQEHTQTNIDIFLPPSLSLAKTEVQKPEQLVVLGETLPSATISVVVDESTTFKTKADGAGNWKVAIASDGLTVGRHNFYARASSPGGQQSPPTPRQTFEVLDQSQTTSQPLPVPVITYPRTGDSIKAETAIVRGTADPFMRVELWDRNRILGSVFADDSGSWQLTIALVQEAYQLRARACRDEVCSRFSATVSFTRSLPLTPGLQTELHRYSYTTVVGEPITLTLIVSGGQPPYTLEVMWDDGNSQRLEFAQASVSLTHQYRNAGRYSGSVQVTDASGRTTELAFSVQVNSQSQAFTWWDWLHENTVNLLALLAVALTGIFLIGARRRRGSASKNDDPDGYPDI